MDRDAPTPAALRPCPSSPNCVSSQGDPSDDAHWIRPLPLEEETAAALARLKRVVLGMPRTRLIDEGERYLHFTFKSRLLGFVDDVEMLLAPEEGVIHVRSASRTGYRDFGVNRKRVEEIRRRWEAD